MLSIVLLRTETSLSHCFLFPFQHISSRRHKDRAAGKPAKPKYSPYSKPQKGQTKQPVSHCTPQPAYQQQKSLCRHNNHSSFLGDRHIKPWQTVFLFVIWNCSLSLSCVCSLQVKWKASKPNMHRSLLLCLHGKELHAEIWQFQVSLLISKKKSCTPLLKCNRVCSLIRHIQSTQQHLIQ